MIPETSILEQIALADQIGLGVEVHLPAVLAAGPDRVRSALDCHRRAPVIAATGLLPGAVLRYPLDLGAVHRGLAALQAIRCPVVRIVLDHRTNFSYTTAEEETAKRLNTLAVLASGYQVTLAVEALGTPARHSPRYESGPILGFRTLPQVDRLLDRVNQRVGICVDSMSWAATGSDLRHLSGLRSRIRHVRIADVPSRVPVSAWGAPQRLMPGDGGLPWHTFSQELSQSGYAGVLTVAATTPSVRRLPPLQIAARASRAVTRIRRLQPRNAPQRQLA